LTNIQQSVEDGACAVRDESKAWEARISEHGETEREKLSRQVNEGLTNINQSVEDGACAVRDESKAWEARLSEHGETEREKISRHSEREIEKLKKAADIEGLKKYESEQGKYETRALANDSFIHVFFHKTNSNCRRKLPLA